MYPLLITSLSACLLTSCSVSDFNAKTPSPNAVPTVVQASTVQKGVGSPGVTDPAIVATILRDAYSEERLAEDVYTLMVAKYPQFTEVMNIINSEEKHSEQVGRLLDARGISRPTDYGSYASTYEVLKKMIDTSLTQAIEAWVMVEVWDIDHLLTEYKTVEDTDVRRVFENIGGGSFNHLRAFLRLAQGNNYSVTTDSARYMTSAEINSTGSLKSKMTDLLIANNLPTFGTQGGRNGGNGDWTGPTWSGNRRGGGQGQGNGMGPMNR
jgi:hypothetical protein